jgi:hypothetical protein
MRFSSVEAYETGFFAMDQILKIAKPCYRFIYLNPQESLSFEYNDWFSRICICHKPFVVAFFDQFTQALLSLYITVVDGIKESFTWRNSAI